MVFLNLTYTKYVGQVRSEPHKIKWTKARLNKIKISGYKVAS
jgi:ribosomal protein L24E